MATPPPFFGMSGALLDEGGWVVVLFVTTVLFWALAAVCEEYFVPALSVVTEVFNIDSDVAGATLMAIGASSPELFASFIALFITHSDLGVGTVIGSELFNHLIICAGSILYARGQTLSLSWRPLCRDVLFYGISCGLLLWSIHDVSPEPTDDDSGSADFLHIHLRYAGAMLFTYVLYAATCAYYSSKVIPFLCPLRPTRKDSSGGGALGESEGNAAAPSPLDHNVMRLNDPLISPGPLGGNGAYLDNTMESVGPGGGLARRVMQETAEPAENFTSIAPRASTTLEDGRNIEEAFDYDANTRPGPCTVLAMRLLAWCGGIDYSDDGRESMFFTGADPRFAGAPAPRRTGAGAQYESLTTAGAATATATGTDATALGSKPEVSPEADHERVVVDSEPRGSEASAAPRPSMSRVLRAANVVDAALGQRDIGASERTANSYSCYLWKKSRYYSRVTGSASRRAWQMRWFTIALGDGVSAYGEMRSWKTKSEALKSAQSGDVAKSRYFGLKGASHVEIWDAQRRILKLWMRGHNRNFYFQAPSEAVMLDAVDAIQTLVDGIRLIETTRRRARRDAADAAGRSVSVAAGSPSVTFADDQKPRLVASADGGRTVVPAGGVGDNMMSLPPVGEEEDDHESPLDWPDSPLARVAHVVLFPLKAGMHYTIPDVRCPGGHHKWSGACIMSVVWLAGLSYLMCMCVESLGDVFHLSSATMGLTVGAAGTSFPNLYSSMLVARQGLGNMAVSNAFGSNVFNILIGLGLPWFMYILCVDGGDPYAGIRSSASLKGSIVLLIVLLAGFVVMLVSSSFVLRKWMAYLFIVMYIAFLVQVFVFPDVDYTPWE